MSNMKNDICTWVTNHETVTAEHDWLIYNKAKKSDNVISIVLSFLSRGKKIADAGENFYCKQYICI